MDFVGPFDGKVILVVVDSRPKWIEAYLTDSASKVTELSCTLSAQFGILRWLSQTMVLVL